MAASKQLNEWLNGRSFARPHSPMKTTQPAPPFGEPLESRQSFGIVADPFGTFRQEDDNSVGPIEQLGSVVPRVVGLYEDDLKVVPTLQEASNDSLSRHVFVR